MSATMRKRLRVGKAQSVGSPALMLFTTDDSHFEDFLRVPLMDSELSPNNLHENNDHQETSERIEQGE